MKFKFLIVATIILALVGCWLVSPPAYVELRNFVPNPISYYIDGVQVARLPAGDPIYYRETIISVTIGYHRITAFDGYRNYPIVVYYFYPSDDLIYETH